MVGQPPLLVFVLQNVSFFSFYILIFSSLFLLLLAVTVLERMLLLDPEERITAAEALALPYFAEFRDPEEETVCEPFDFTVVNAELTVDQWKREEDVYG